DVVFNPAPIPQAGVPALGAGRPAPAGPAVRATPAHGGYVLENDVVRVVITAEGLITSAVDVATGRDAIPAGAEANLLQLHPDFPAMWDAWDVDRYYRNRVDDLRAAESLTIETAADGVTVIVSRRFSQSALTQRITLHAGSRALVFAQTTDWHETEKFLKVAFPLDIHAEHTAAETQFGYAKRVTHTNTSWEAAKFETAMHRFVHVEEPGFGVALTTDSTYGYDVTRDSTPETGVTTTVRLSLLRAPRFPDPATDQGEQTHVYALVIGADIADATAAGLVMNLPLRAAPAADIAADAVTPPTLAPVVETSGGVLVSAVKLAADRSGDLIVRVYEPYGRRATGTVRFGRAVSGVTAVSLIEDANPSPVPVPLVGDRDVTVSLTPFEVRTLRVTL
ncbi:glycoside hydrolase family 38 C-terminal domain-containing protein, partial [Microbacterium sp.]|uniref:glycoside hydrolase family 38 C-terminal domain-containing protein n=1 Tax=Microbacterium sp. TaxID=51671 RepID=UPI0028124039